MSKRKREDDGTPKEDDAVAVSVEGAKESTSSSVVNQPVPGASLTRIKYKGVWKSRDRYQANITIDGDRRSLGTFDTPKQAAEAYDRAAVQELRPIATLNFPNQVPTNYAPKKYLSSRRVKFKGITRRGKRFSSQITSSVNGKPDHLGIFDTDEEAAKAYDRAAIIAGYPKSKLNFPKDAPPNYRPKKRTKVRAKNKSRVKTGQMRKTVNKFQLEMEIDGKKETLGFTNEEASVAYDLASIL